MKYKVEHAFHLIFIIQGVIMILTKNIFQLFKYQNLLICFKLNTFIGFKKITNFLLFNF